MKLSIMHGESAGLDYIVINPRKENEWKLLVEKEFIKGIKTFLERSFRITGLVLDTPSNFHNLKIAASVADLQAGLVKRLEELQQTQMTFTGFGIFSNADDSAFRRVVVPNHERRSPPVKVFG